MVQSVRGSTVLLEDLSSTPDTHHLVATTTYNPSSRKSNTSGLHKYPQSYASTHRHTQLKVK